MTEYHISLPDVESVKCFVNAVTRFDCDIDIVSDRYVVDAKSIMGIFSLDLSRPLLLKINSSNTDDVEAIRDAISEFAVDQT